MKWITLTRIALLTGLLTALLQGAILFGLDITQDQQAWVTGFIVLIGGAIHGFFNPNIPVGVTEASVEDAKIP